MICSTQVQPAMGLHLGAVMGAISMANACMHLKARGPMASSQPDFRSPPLAMAEPMQAQCDLRQVRDAPEVRAPCRTAAPHAASTGADGWPVPFAQGFGLSAVRGVLASGFALVPTQAQRPSPHRRQPRCEPAPMALHMAFIHTTINSRTPDCNPPWFIFFR